MNRPPMAVLALALVSFPAWAAGEEEAAVTHCPPTEATTVFVADATMRRHDGSANRLTEAHRDAEQQGLQFRDLAVYTENGDLQGFFVTYTRPHPCNAGG